MLIKELKEILKDLPDDADILMQKKITKKKSFIAPIISSRVIDAPDGIHKRLVLMNLKAAKNKNTY